MKYPVEARDYDPNVNAFDARDSIAQVHLLTNAVAELQRIIMEMQIVKKTNERPRKD